MGDLLLKFKPYKQNYALGNFYVSNYFISNLEFVYRTYIHIYLAHISL